MVSQSRIGKDGFIKFKQIIDNASLGELLELKKMLDEEIAWARDNSPNRCKRCTKRCSGYNPDCEYWRKEYGTEQTD